MRSQSSWLYDARLHVALFIALMFRISLLGMNALPGSSEPDEAPFSETVMAEAAQTVLVIPGTTALPARASTMDAPR